MSNLDLSYWDQRWREGQTGWIEPDANASLREHVAQLQGCQRVLVPLCGNTPDMTFLAQHGLEVVGLEGVREAATRFFSERGSTTHEGSILGAAALVHESVSIAIADVFAIQAQAPIFDAVYDRGALVAIDPVDRVRYISSLHQWVRADARWLCVLFEHDLQEPDCGPPFSIRGEELAALFPTREVQLLGRRDLAESMTRMAARGATFLHETTWLVA